MTLLAAAVESVVLLTLLLRRGESVSCPAVRSIVCFEYFALLAVSLSGLLARWVWPHAPHAGTVLLAGWGVALLALCTRLALLRWRRRRGAAAGAKGATLVLGGKEAKEKYFGNKLSPERVTALVGEEVVQVVSGGQFTLARTSSGEIWSWGSGGEDNALGHGGKEQKVVPEKVTALKGQVVTHLAAGHEHVAAVTADGALYTFGDGGNGRLGHGDTETQTAPKLVEVQEWGARRVVSVVCSNYHTAAVLEDGALYTFGRGGDGLLGHGDTKNRPTPTRVALPAAAQSQPRAVITGIAFSKTHACAWTEEGRVFVWGKDAGLHGKLGPSDVAAASATDAAPGAEHASEAAMVAPAGAAPLQPREIAGLPQRAERRRCRDSGRGDRVVEVMLGGDHSAYARTERGRVFAWGRGIGGQLGLGSTERDHDTPRLMGPVQGRFVTGVFVAHDDTVYVASGTAQDAAVGLGDEPADDVHNPLRKRRPEADDISEAGGNNITPVMATADQLSSGATSSAQV